MASSRLVAFLIFSWSIAPLNSSRTMRLIPSGTDSSDLNWYAIRLAPLPMPIGVRMLDETQIVIARIAGDFRTQPIGFSDLLLVIGCLQLGDHQTLVFTCELINLPFQLPTFNDVPGFLNQRL